MTFPERILWDELRRLKLNIRRQAPIGRYIADFAHHDSRLIIEIDGPLHSVRFCHRKMISPGQWRNVTGEFFLH